MRRARALSAACAFAAAGAAAVTPPKAPIPGPPTTKLTSIYNLAHVGAILDICASDPLTTPGTAKSKEIAELASRIFALVRTLGAHYRDGELPAVYASTKKQMASDERLKRHVHETHRDCGERALADMRAYVADNEQMIARAIEARRPAGRQAPSARE
jgi:hypothetical protein